MQLQCTTVQLIMAGQIRAARQAQVMAGAAAREAALGEAQAALQRWSAELEAEHGLRMAKADAAIKRLQVSLTTQYTHK